MDGGGLLLLIVVVKNRILCIGPRDVLQRTSLILHKDPLSHPSYQYDCNYSYNDIAMDAGQQHKNHFTFQLLLLTVISLSPVGAASRCHRLCSHTTFAFVTSLRLPVGDACCRPPPSSVILCHLCICYKPDHFAAI